MINNNNGNLPSSEDLFHMICDEIVALHNAKNHDYGNAFGDTYLKFVSEGEQKMADGYALGLLYNKISRVSALLSSEAMVKNESLEDSLLDLAAYSIMTLAERRRIKALNT